MAAAQSKTWNIQNYILAALGGTLAATAIVIMVSAIFEPARISFVVTHASRSTPSDRTGVWLNLTVSANAGGQNCTKVKYESIFIDLGTARSPRDGTRSLPKSMPRHCRRSTCRPLAR